MAHCKQHVSQNIQNASWWHGSYHKLLSSAYKCNTFISGNKLLAYWYDPLVSKRLVLDKNVNGVLWNVTVAYPMNKIMNKIHIRHHIYICNSGEYVSLTLVNDNVKDCKSGDDETSFSCFIHGKIKNDSLCKTSCLTLNCTWRTGKIFTMIIHIPHRKTAFVPKLHARLHIKNDNLLKLPYTRITLPCTLH